MRFHKFWTALVLLGSLNAAMASGPADMTFTMKVGGSSGHGYAGGADAVPGSGGTGIGQGVGPGGKYRSSSSGPSKETVYHHRAEKLKSERLVQEGHVSVAKTKAVESRSSLKQSEKELKKVSQKLKDSKARVKKAASKRDYDPHSEASRFARLSIDEKMTYLRDTPIEPVMHPGEAIFMGAAVSRTARSAAAEFCFPGDTPICITDRDSRPIQSILAGDYVQSCNLENDVCECRQVLAVGQRTADHLIQFSIQGRMLRTTDEHPFYLISKHAFVPAQDLRKGDALRTVSGETVLIDEVDYETGPVTVYNLQVDQFQNYFAGSVLVHNCNLSAKAKTAERVRHLGQMKEFEKQTTAQLEKSIKSFDKNIEKHSKWIKDPKLKYGDQWDTMTEKYKDNALHHWGKDIERAKEFKQLAEEILKKR